MKHTTTIKNTQKHIKTYKTFQTHIKHRFSIFWYNLLYFILLLNRGKLGYWWWAVGGVAIQTHGFDIFSYIKIIKNLQTHRTHIKQIQTRSKTYKNIQTHIKNIYLL